METNIVHTLMQQQKICVLIPAYNSEKTIADVVNSVLQYTSDIIVVNDGSTDGSIDSSADGSIGVSAVGLITICVPELSAPSSPLISSNIARTSCANLNSVSLARGPAVSMRSELLVAHAKLGQLPLLTVYVLPM